MNDETTDKGTYTLLIEVGNPTTIEVGALGELGFKDGIYGYTGSAFGTGGLKRLDRHASVASGENPARHWHVDYLLGCVSSTLVAAYTTPEDAECSVARSIGGEAVPGFGCSDCSCNSHLKRTTPPDIAEAYAGLRHEERRFE